MPRVSSVSAMSDTGGFIPDDRRVRAAYDGFMKGTEPDFPSAGQAREFPVSHSLLGHISESKETSHIRKHHLMRPKSPTRRYDGMLKDTTHFTYAFMESTAADHEIEKIFNVQNHELVCAIGSKALITDNINKIVASLEFHYFWCNFCPFTTNSKHSLTQHVLEHRFCCKYCAYESFCRSDIVRHMHKMHKDFKNTAANLYYLTLLSDYLRVKSNEKENKDPDEDISNIEQEKTDAPLLDFEGSKHKSVLEKDEFVSHVNKAQRLDLDHGAENNVFQSSVISHKRQENISQKRPEKISQKTPENVSQERPENVSQERPENVSQERPENVSQERPENVSLERPENVSQERPESCWKSHSSNHPVLPAKADYDIFDMEVENISDNQFHEFLSTTDECNTKTCSSVFNHTSAVSSNKHSAQNEMLYVGPGTQDSCLQTSVTTFIPTSSGISTHHPHGLYKKSNKSGKSNLYLDCAYCEFQSISQNEIKDHSSRLHPEKPQCCAALIKNIASDSFVIENKKGNEPGPSTATSRQINKNKPHFNHLNSNVACLLKDSGDSKSDNAANSQTCTASLNVKGVFRSLPEVRRNASAHAIKGAAFVKCFHCLYTSGKNRTMKNHLCHKHRGMGLVAVTSDSPSSEIFFCAREACNFYCEDASLYLNHADRCTPWNKPNLVNVEMEPHLLECLDQTISLARVSQLKEFEHKKSRLLKDSCITIPEDVTESIHSLQLLFKEKSPVETHPLWIQTSQPSIHHKVEASLVKMVKKTENSKDIYTNTLENACNHLCPQNLNSPVDTDQYSNPVFPKVLPSEGMFVAPSLFETEKADKLYVCNSSSQTDLNKHNSNICPSAASKDKFASDNFVDVETSKAACLSELNPEVGEMLIDHCESDLVKPLTDFTVAKNNNKAYTFSINEEVLSQKVLTVDESKSVLTVDKSKTGLTVDKSKSDLTIENNGPGVETMQLTNNNDHSVTHFINCKDNSNVDSLDERNTVKNMSSDESKLEVHLLGKTDTSFIKSNGDAETDKHDNPSLKLRLKVVRHANVYSFSNNAQLLGPSDTNKQIRASDSIGCNSSKHSDEENDISMQSDCTEASQIQNLWIKDLIDSTEESDSDQTFCSTDINDSINSVPDRLTNSPDYVSDNKNSFFVSNILKSNQTLNSSQEQTSLCVEGKSKQCIVPGQVMREEPETAGVIKPCYSFVPLRSAAVKAISKMKPLLTCETESTDYNSRNNCRGKKSVLKRKLSYSSSNHNTNQKSPASRKRRKLSDQKFASEMSKSAYMCQYCIDISEGPLKKIKSHVLSKHSSMPPVVVNSFKQRHHINCQFFVCPYDSCYKLSRTQEESEAHKCTHEQANIQQSSPELSGNNLPFSTNINDIKKTSDPKPVRACRVELNVLDMSQINSVGSVLFMQEKKKYQCLYCTSYYYDETLQGMKAHYFQEHEGQLIVIRDTEAHRLQLPSRIYVCDNPHCQQFYINRSDLDSHANSHKSNSTVIYECASCGWYSASHTVACHHAKTEHADEEALSLVHMQVSVDEYGQTSKIIL